ncbi:MAG: TolC family protein, partial [Acidobacteriota bacterium]|nr:TolC family protein [Acidobacteriota bacterium]
APPLTLAQAVAMARATAPLQAARTRADGADAAWHLAGRLPNPSIEVRTENWTFRGISRPPLGPGLDLFVTATQPVELAGKRGHRRDLAAAGLSVAQADVGQLERLITLETARTYLDALRARGLIDVLATNRTSLEALVEILSKRVAEGAAAESDLLKFRTEAARVDTQLARTRIGLERRLTALGALLGLAGPVEAGRLVEPPPVPAPAGDAGLLARGAADRQPAVVLARARLAQAEQALALERARRVPDPALTGGYKRTDGDDTIVAAVVVPLPLFDRNGQAVALAQADAQAARLQLEALTRQATADVTATVRTAQALAARAARVDADLLAPAAAVRTSARTAFEEGAVDLLTLVDAERVYADARREALDLKLDAFLSAVESRLALGQEDLP